MKLKNVCLICGAVVITWVTMLVLMWLGVTVDKTILAMLMGMSAGAIATKYIQGLFWKAYFVILAGPLIWFTLHGPLRYAWALLAIILFRWLFSIKLKARKDQSQSDRFGDCC